MQRQQSSIGQELLWLLVWAIIFAIITTLLIKLAVLPHGFNDRIAMMIAAIVSGVAMIALRAYVSRRA